jgi:hypothetical protein
MDKGCEGAGPKPAGDVGEDQRDGTEKDRKGGLSREERLALQLRENLKKRKALARVKRQSDGGDDD